jgi:hypothetical protein
MGVKESLMATSFIGVIFALFSAQPLMLLGVTGPMLIFEESLANVSAVRMLLARAYAPTSLCQTLLNR